MFFFFLSLLIPVLLLVYLKKKLYFHIFLIYLYFFILFFNLVINISFYLYFSSYLCILDIFKKLINIYFRRTIKYITHLIPLLFLKLDNLVFNKENELLNLLLIFIILLSLKLNDLNLFLSSIIDLYFHINYFNF